MSNVIQLTFPSRRDQRAATIAALLDTFANHRRDMDDVFWMKENAEILNILECTGEVVDQDALAPYRAFYDTIETRLEFFPQYYRFLLSICQDLEAHGIGSGKARALAQWVADQGLVDAELSDLQRAEAQRLLARNGVMVDVGQEAINARLHRFVSRADTFAIPNKKAAYELTHIVFYLSEYGRRDPGLNTQTRKSLEFAGTLALLDCNWDLLAETLVAMRYCGMTPPAEWDAAIAQATSHFTVAEGDDAVRQDDYHEYLVCNWALSTAGETAFPHRMTPGPVSFHADPARPSALREMSQILFDLDARRSDDWHLMRDYLCDTISAAGSDTLMQAEAACDGFGDFFARFARTNLRNNAKVLSA
ncbi:DUF6902 family protein [Pseudooceanicola sp. MF1-13]|uniref:DUF6902 family protein n=1 Tax=Pseudooceanicola sp. MF1-13 TaxID=3379095 RepID=UPI0038926147